MSDRNSLGTILKERNVKINDLASAVGVTPAAVYNWTRGVMPSKANRTKVANYLEIEPSELSFDPPMTESNGGGIYVTVRGDGLNLEMVVSKSTARSLLNLLLNGEPDPRRHPTD
jgi:transcriptional regulator with XRE-family HTH domain